MIISAQKSALTSEINFQNIHQSDTSKISVLNICIYKQKKLQVFLTKLKLYIEFNHEKFRFKMNKKLYIVFLLKNAVFN